jgi:hypothetical protein
MIEATKPKRLLFSSTGLRAVGDGLKVELTLTQHDLNTLISSLVYAGQTHDLELLSDLKALRESAYGTNACS